MAGAGGVERGPGPEELYVGCSAGLRAAGGGAGGDGAAELVGLARVALVAGGERGAASHGAVTRHLRLAEMRAELGLPAGAPAGDVLAAVMDAAGFGELAAGAAAPGDAPAPGAVASLRARLALEVFHLCGEHFQAARRRELEAAWGAAVEADEAAWEGAEGAGAGVDLDGTGGAPDVAGEGLVLPWAARLLFGPLGGGRVVGVSDVERLLEERVRDEGTRIKMAEGLRRGAGILPRA